MLKVFGSDGPLALSDMQEIQGQRWHLIIVETSSSRFEDLNSRKKKNNNNNMRICFEDKGNELREILPYTM